MAAPTVVKRGKASVEGIAGSFDVIVYPVAQTGKLTHQWEEEIVKDVHGFDAAWLLRNEHATFDVGMKLLGDTNAHAIAGGVLLAPMAAVVLSGFDLAVLNTTYHTTPGEDIDLANTKVGDINYKLRRYINSDQNTAAATTPS
jgi:hypothetical protein